jgi:hypothetical protein
MKRIKILFTVTASLCCIVATSQASFIVNGDFEAGDTGFTSMYGSSTDLANGGEGGGAGLYGVGTDPNYFHSSFT